MKKLLKTVLFGLAFLGGAAQAATVAVLDSFTFNLFDTYNSIQVVTGVSSTTKTYANGDPSVVLTVPNLTPSASFSHAYSFASAVIPGLSVVSFGGIDTIANFTVDVLEDSINIFHAQLTDGTITSGFGSLNFTLMSGKEYLVILAGDVGNSITSGYNFTARAVTTVPLPAAAWLFGSAILGFMGFSARRKV